ncbi:MAG: hypothetical protein K9L96_05185 [Candidatus Omnitrophica bacterium]|nr:hypothetical protein [Candidatus Omnitrophota bacterium]
MPELPDVEIFRRYLNRKALNKKIKDVDIKNSKIISAAKTKYVKALRNKKINSSKRYGKYLFAELGKKNNLMFHFGMTGFLKYFKNLEAEPQHGRFLIKFYNGYYLAWNNQRLLGEVKLVDSIKGFIEKKNLGPDALGLNLPLFEKLIGGKTGSIKSALMKQELIAGVGNIYSDEILYQAKINPASNCKKLKNKDIESLFENLKKVLKEAIKYKADPDKMPDSWLLTHRSKEGRCGRCGKGIKHQKISGRTSYFCPRCQKKS